MISLKEVIKICELIFPDYVIESGQISFRMYKKDIVVAHFIELVDLQIRGRVFPTDYCGEILEKLYGVFTTTYDDKMFDEYSVCFYITGVK